MTFYLCYAIVAIGLLSAIIGLFSKRLGGLEAIIVCQISIISLIFVDSLLFAPFTLSETMKYSIGHHLKLFSSSV